MNDKPVILVTGATGALGPRIVERFRAEDYALRTLTREPPPTGMWPDDVETFVGDVTDENAVKNAISGAYAVIHLAAMLHVEDPLEQLRELFWKINVGGTKTVLDVAVRANVKKVIFFSTIAVYGKTAGRIVDEEDTPQPDTIYGQTKLEAERMILSAKNAAGEPIGTVLRLAAVYGSRVKGNYRQLFGALRRGRFIPVGRGLNRRTVIYDKDVAAAAILAMQTKKAAGRLYNLSDGSYHCVRDIIAAICEGIGRKPPRFSLPVVAVRSAAGAMEAVCRLTVLKPPVTKAMVDKYIEDVAVDSTLIQREIGFCPRYDLTAGWQDAAREILRLEKKGTK